VVASIGLGLGHIQEDIFAILIYTMAFTSIVSSYFIKYNNQIYRAFEQTLNRWGLRRFGALQEETGPHEAYPIVILGYHRGAQSLLEAILEKYPELLEKILVVDFNLEVLKELQSMQIAGVFGDISHPDTLEHAHIEEAEIIVSTIPDVLLKGTNNLQLVKICRNLAPEALIVATADLPDKVESLKVAGANEVILPYSMAGEFLAGYIRDMLKSRSGSELAYA
jgi:hypothetical protein